MRARTEIEPLESQEAHLRDFKMMQHWLVAIKVSVAFSGFGFVSEAISWQPWLSWSLLCRSGWPHPVAPASAFQVLGLKVCDATACLFLTGFSVALEPVLEHCRPELTEMFLSWPPACWC